MLQLPGFLCLSSLTSLEGGIYHVISQRRSVLHHILHFPGYADHGLLGHKFGTGAKYPYFALLFHRDALNPEKQQFFAHFPNDNAEQNTAAAGSDVPPPCHPPSMTMMTLMHSPWQTNLGPRLSWQTLLCLIVVQFGPSWSVMICPTRLLAGSGLCFIGDLCGLYFYLRHR